MKKTALVIMAAGIGSRFGKGIKQLEPVGPNGEIIMDYSIHDALEAGFNKVVFIIRKDLEKDFKEVIGDRISKITEVAYAFQELDDLPAGFIKPEGRTKPWGTGQAVLACKGLVKEPFAVINADDYYGKDPFVKQHDYLVQEHDGNDTMPISMAGFVLGNTLSDHGGVTRGICVVDENGNPLEQVKIRTILTCKCKNGVCSKCYGANMATGEAVQVGEAVGIMAAQSIGEPGTQLTMRTFHNGGVAGDDITQGLPRVEELFEARRPKGLAIITEIAGRATLSDTKKKREVIVTNEETGESKSYLIPYGSRIKVQDGVMLEAGDELTEGSVNPHDILKIKGLRATQDYMLQEVQRVYRLQGVEINDKHIEVIVRQMLKKIRIEEKGDTEFLPGTMVDVLDFEEVNEQLAAEGKEPATGEQIMLGITKASLATESFLSAASFQETTKVLTEAAIKGKVDHLVGLKENVIIGKHIPAGTGMKKYRDVKLNTDIKMEDELDLEDDLNLDEDFDMDENVDLTDEFVEENTEDAAEDVAEASVEEPETEE